jgi:hypothetical protein
MLDGMATLKQKIAAEQHARAMLEDHGLPQPDAVEYGYTCIRLYWLEEKVVMVVDIDKPPEDFELLGESLSDPEDEAEDREEAA